MPYLLWQLQVTNTASCKDDTGQEALVFKLKYVLKIALLLLAVSEHTTFGFEADSHNKQFTDTIKPLMQKLCVDCHRAGKAKGDIRLDDINRDIINGNQHDLWEEILELVETHSMPPVKAVQPSKGERALLLEWIRTGLQQRLMKERGVGGRVVMRRLNLKEYNNTLRDLLGLRRDASHGMLPDITYHGFDHIAEVQELSPTQIMDYIQAARRAVREYYPIRSDPPAFNAEYRIVFDVDGKTAKLTARISATGSRVSEESYRGFIDTLVHKNNKSRGVFADRLGEWGDPVELNVKGLPGNLQAKSKGKGLPGVFRVNWPYFPGDDAPMRIRVKAVDVDGAGAAVLEVYTKNRLISEWDVKSKPGWHEIDFVPLEYEKTKHKGSLFRKQKVVQLVLVNASNESIGGKKKAKRAKAGAIQLLAIEADFYARAAKLAQEDLLQGLDPSSGRAFAKSAIERFATKAFRRDLRHSELVHFLSVYDRYISQALAVDEAVRETFVAILVSPAFLFLAEDLPTQANKRRPLNAAELASRLSYFLWSSMPDDALMAKARSGVLLKPEVQAQEVERMLSDERSHEFARGFIREWIRLDLLDDLMVEDNRWLYLPLQNAIRNEPVRFYEELLRSNKSMLELIDSDFAMLNEPLADLYGIKGVFGREFRRVDIKGHTHRGGLLTQAAAMALTTDGMATSPIYRGVWLLEKILDQPPPEAPADVPPLDDSPEQSLSLRQQLAVHRENPSCAACHDKIDPLGWPFQRYSIIGDYKEDGWERMKKKKGKKNEKPDLHAMLPGGVKVDSIQDLKKHIRAHHHRDVARSIARHMLIYALGRPLDISDARVLDRIVNQVEKDGYKARAFVHAIIQSPPFQEK